jgi:hypothetical protein
MNIKHTHALLPGTAFYFAAVLLLFVTWHTGQYILAVTDGELVYGLDDPYIHLSIARTLVDHGVYGVSPDAVSFAASSMLWPFLLAAGYATTGLLDQLPLYFNVLFVLCCLWIVEAFGKREGISVAGRFMMHVFFIIITPVLPLIFNGMEHVLHLLSVLLLFYVFVGMETRRKPAADYRQLALLASLLVFSILVRYESVAIGLVLSASMLLRRRWLPGIVLLLAAVLPVILVGLILMANGGYFLPNSLLVKGPTLDPRILIGLPNFLYYHVLWPDTQSIHWRVFYLATLLVGILFVLPRHSQSYGFRWVIYTLLAMIVLHVVTVRLDHFNRYTGYIIGTGVTVAMLAFLSRMKYLAVDARERWETHVTVPMILIAIITCIPFLMHGMTQNRHVATASRNIYEQQFQMGRFLSTYYKGQPVAINDLGLTVYDGGIEPVDLVGLAEQRIAIARRRGVLTTDSLRAISRERNVHVALLYRSWFQREISIPSEWIPVEEWVIQDNLVCGSDTLNFYALNAEAAVTLQENLREFRTRLPGRVIVREIGGEQ